MSRKRYPTDVTDAQWEQLDRLLPKPKCGTAKGGHPVVVDRREVVNAIFCHLRAGGAWRVLPHDLPAWQTVYGRFRDWRLDGTWDKVHAALREEVRIEAGYPPTPETLRVDSQTVKITHRGGGRWLLGAVRHRRPRVREVIADSGLSKRFQQFVRTVCRWAVTITANAKDGFKVHTRRWVVERTFAWFVRYRRLMVDYEYHTETTEAMIQAAMIHRMPRKLHPSP